MALTVEDGTAKTDADSYISVADADTRHAALGNTEWASLTTAVKEQNLRNATIYMIQKYRTLWQGTRTTSTQSTDWPRYGVYVDGFSVDYDVLPVDIANACADLGLRANEGDLLTDLSREVIRKKIGPLETEYASGSQEDKRYRSIDLMLAPYLGGTSSANSMPIKRVGV
jgi:hypothetical protein